MVVVPTYNEPDTIATLLSRLAEHASDADVLVVDDASPDGTTTVVRDTPGFADTIHLLERSGKNGLGAAYRAGFRWALDRGYDVGRRDGRGLVPPGRPTARVGAGIGRRRCRRRLTLRGRRRDRELALAAQRPSLLGNAYV